MKTNYEVGSLPELPGMAPWNAMLHKRMQAPVLEHNETCDIAIVGAGFAGLAAARRLLQLDPRLNISILDALDLGEGGIGRNSGFMIDLPHDLTSQNYAGSGAVSDNTATGLNRHAIEFVAKAVDDYSVNPLFFERAGKINGATTVPGHRTNQQYVRHLDAMHEPYEILDTKMMQEVTGSSFYRSGVFTPGTVMLQPAGYAHGMATGLARDGVKLYTKTPVLGFSKISNGWQLSTAKGILQTHKIILAVNGHLESFGFERKRLMHLFLFASMTRALNQSELKKLGGQPTWGITPADPVGTTMRRISSAESGTRIMSRAGVVYCPSTRPTEAQMKGAIPKLHIKFNQRFPNLSDVEMQYQWAGHLCLSYNGVSLAKPIEEGVFSACVQNGLGATRGTLTGIAAAEQTLGVESNIAQFFANEKMPARLPPEPIATLGARTVLKWKEWRAGSE